MNAILVTVLTLGLLSTCVTGRDVSCMCTANLVREPGVTCRSSSNLNPSSCANVFDGNYEPSGQHAWISDGENQGAWLEIELPQPMKIQFARVFQRCSLKNQFTGFDLVLDGSKTITQKMPCNGGDGDDLTLGECKGLPYAGFRVGNTAKTFRFNFHDGCTLDEGGPGIREIQIHQLVACDIPDAHCIA